MWIRQGNYWLNLSHIRGLQVKGNAISAMPMDSMLFSSDLVDEFGDERKVSTKMAEYAELANCHEGPCWRECTGNKWMDINSLKIVMVRREVDEYFVMGTLPTTNVPGVRLWGPFADVYDRKTKILEKTGEQLAYETMEEMMNGLTTKQAKGPQEIERKSKKK